MKLKELHALMQDIAPFPRPKVELEQYPTGPHLASRLLFAVDSSYDEVAGRTVVDLGCGTAMLSIGAALVGARHVVGVDIDADALEVAVDNVEGFEGQLPIDLVLADVRELPRRLLRLRADTVIMNPPFGTKQKGVDIAFLRSAFAVATHSVYSLHKSSTREFIAKTAKRELGASSAEVLAQLRYDLPATMKFHKQKSVDIEVDLWRFEVGAEAASHQSPEQRILQLQQQQQQEEGGEEAEAASAVARGSGSRGPQSSGRRKGGSKGAGRRGQHKAERVEKEKEEEEEEEDDQNEDEGEEEGE